ncbi:MAG: radical SAM protein [Planctomycetota bacterium]
MSPSSSFPLPTPHPHQWVAYLTARCNYACDYCMQKPGLVPGQRRKPWGRYQELAGRQWVDALNAFPVRPEAPLILTGGEPSLHKDFAFVASRLEGYRLDLTSNLTFDIDAVAREMRARGKTFYSSFHTYHPKFADPQRWVDQAERLRDSGMVEHPVFSMVQLERFPHFRDDEHDRNQGHVTELAERRGLLYQFNEFRGTHLGAPYDRQQRARIECTSAWVNFDPEGNIHNCVYHLTERRHAFGNVTRIDACRAMPAMGTFFSCGDFGWCDPCHENSGHGAFRDVHGTVFGRTSDDAGVYLRAMAPAAVRDVALRYARQGNLAEAERAFKAAIHKAREEGRDDHESWADLGVVLYRGGKPRQALGALLHAIDGGTADRATLSDTMAIALELGERDHARASILRRVPAQILDPVEAALLAAGPRVPAPS